MGARWFGASVLRKEDPSLLTGNGRYVDDIKLPGTLAVAFVRSPHAHAKLLSIDVAAARALPGVHDIIVFADLPEAMRSNPLPLYVAPAAIKQLHVPYALARDEVCYVGEPVAAVIADTRHIAEDAVALVDVDYDVLPAVSDCLSGLDVRAPVAHAGNGDNIAARVPIAAGDIEAAFRDAPYVFSERLFQHRGGPFFIECRGVLANYDRNIDQLTVYASTQGSHRIKRAYLDVLDLADHQVRVITQDVGGGFGPKGAFYPEYAVAAVASMKLGRPVKWIEDRRENFLATHQERDQYWDLEIAVEADGRLRGLRGRLVHDAGAYLPWGLVLPWIAATTVPGPYLLPAYSMDLVVVYTNKIQCTPVRGAGRPQAVFAMERMMDLVASKLGIDRAEVRRRNFVKPEQMPYKVGLVFRDGRPVTYDSGDYPSCQEKALEAAGYKEFSVRQAEALKRGRYIGVGISSAVEATGLGPYESATLRVSTTGKITLYTGATPQGQSHHTTLAQIAADQLGVSYEDINVVTGDSAATGLGIGTFAARTAVNAGSSVHVAAIELGEKIRKVASDLLEADASDLELVDGNVQVKGAPGLRKSLREVAVHSVGMYGYAMRTDYEPGLEATAHFRPDQSTYSNSAHVAEVEVDIETGHIKILRFVVNHDCGRAINPKIVEGQVVGGVAHGVGNALFERLRHSDDGQPVTTTFAEYLLPIAPDVPRVELHHMETPSPLNPLGVKGAGEGGTIASIAAIVGAVEDALSPFGVRISETPILPDRVVELIAKARSEKS
ncbi:MAG: hypothetical protein RLZ98_183 [Pseudomonadota bacterium]|jgi:carbon-monoxide dehydrogenase large subunit